ncbi:hypothetical protein IEQ34_001458 [Dendrobium chrysotoxum]|uniref:Myb-like domain-containing protein n=1 Tax=Dendrobium chrysotoxum TaxID=161865 RepID=A0AAV7HP49_DENCH|nr:hypothetical protein IEQ34_001458 [Dendrobium chrysotoxum]
MQQQGGSQYGVPPPEMAPPFSSAAMIGIPTGVEYLQQPQQVAEAASPISSRPAPPQPAPPRQQVSIFEDFGSGGGAMVRSFPDEEALGAGEDTERGGGGGNRWPRQETLALLKIRSDMDAVFRDATLKGPLWEDVSRKLAELGYARSAKKCKEKFENVHKYYKRTKEGRAGRQDGKSYRFFTQLEALHSSSGGAAAITSLPSPPSTAVIPSVITSATGSAAQPHKNSSSSLPAPHDSTMTPAPPVARIQPAAAAPPPVAAPAPPSRSVLELSTPAAVVGISFSSNTSSSSASESDGEETEEGGVGALHDGGRKRKREAWPGGTRKMMAFFDGLMKQVMERTEAMQQRFLETIEKREQDRMIREEAWKRQEMARLNREYELMAQERTMAANRDAAVISFLQKFTGIQASQPLAPPISAATPPDEATAPPPTSPQEQLKPPAPVVEAPAMQIETNNNQVERNDIVINQPTSSSEPPAAVSEMADGMCLGGFDTISPSSSSSRWPKQEVLALIRLRSGLESRYLETGPKGPLWEEISLGMKRLGYGRNAKRCKEKWENINKYFKKVKESNKKRPEDAKTCPYFHELDALYRKKQLFGGGGAAANPGIAAQQTQENAITPKVGESLQNPAPIAGLTEQENNKGQKNPTTLRSSDGGNHETSGVQIPRSNGTGLSQLFFGGTPNRGSSTALKKPEDIVRELMGQQTLQHRVVANDYEKLGGSETVDSDTINHDYDDDDEDNDDEDEEDEEEDGKLRYEIQFQRQGVGASSGPARGGNSTGKVPPTAASSAGSFLAMVQ